VSDDSSRLVVLAVVALGGCRGSPAVAVVFKVGDSGLLLLPLLPVLPLLLGRTSTRRPLLDDGRVGGGATTGAIATIGIGFGSALFQFGFILRNTTVYPSTDAVVSMTVDVLLNPYIYMYAFIH
jgi:hypothetical protein